MTITARAIALLREIPLQPHEAAWLAGAPPGVERYIYSTRDEPWKRLRGEVYLINQA